ncbi:hypothetical protein [Methanobrevibacter sp.]|uniref:hypothetical protein n=1 Tax=Methanobrevibacter sp. TaxID=66852 RepID=UPI00388F2E48
MMDNSFLMYSTFQLLAAAAIFVILVYMAKFLRNKLKSSSFLKNSRFANPLEYFPSEPLFYLEQVFYIVIILIFILIILYLTFNWTKGATFIFAFDILISIYLCINRSWDSLSDKVLLFLLIPFASITGILFGHDVFSFLSLFHILGYLYFIQYYYREFLKYTESNGLGLSIIVTFSILLVSFLFTILAEGVSPMDSMTMVSNAFTSNSFDASGKIMIGKVNSLVLAWGGFILSIVGTATLAVSIVMGYVSQEFKDMKDFVKKNKEEK